MFKSKISVLMLVFVSSGSCYAATSSGETKINTILTVSENDTENITQRLDIPPPLTTPLTTPPLEIKDTTLDDLDLIGFKLSDYDLKSLHEFNKMLNNNSKQSTTNVTPLSLSKTSLDCLILNAYHESRGEGYKGIAAVTEVVLNRSRERSRGVCAIIYEPYQFSWTRNRNKRVDSRQYDTVKNHVMKHLSYLDSGGKQFTNGATYFHAKHVRPDWSRNHDFKCTSKVGKHLFYREFKRKSK